MALQKDKATEEVLAVALLRRKRALEQWYSDTQSNDESARDRAGARLQLQLHLRGERKGTNKFTQSGLTINQNGTREQVSSQQTSLRSVKSQLAISERYLRNGFADRAIRGLSKSWYLGPVSLELMLQRVEWDEIEDFLDLPTHQLCGATTSQTRFGFVPGLSAIGSKPPVRAPKAPVTHTALTKFTVSNENPKRQDTAATGTGTSVVKNTSLDKQEEADLQVSRAASDAHLIIWRQHRYFILNRCIASGEVFSAISLKLVLQKKAFEHQARLEIKVQAAHRITENMVAHEHLPSTCNEKYKNTYVGIHSRGLWELTSTQLWKDLEGATCWDQARWTPGGHMYIHTVDGLSTIYIDIGRRTFDIVAVALPKHIHTQPISCKLRCFETKSDVSVNLTFLAKGFVKVHMPALAIIQLDSGCKILPLMETVVELVGAHMDGSD
ncbi:hypothetical protein HBI30_158190 [Parastagonospora nodorum]|nr:hypothetical protein HBI30_158190 [Parastagonospora nodorum]KAH6044986.1 hypothetical protein HBI54_101730 [Parastagonospora nodorum]KAH6446255.1 hypothetical protein HBI58_223080 [Parastagonospora nodorum]KAH6449030.1 hypothetical protein HBI57_197240 [Parastagonospora nodorum]